MQLPLLPVAHDRVPGVVAALEAHDGVRLLGEQIGDLPLSLVAPLGADYHDSGHAKAVYAGARQAERARARNSRRLSSPKRGIRSPQISTRRDTVREPSRSDSSSGIRLVVATIARSAS